MVISVGSLPLTFSSLFSPVTIQLQRSPCLQNSWWHCAGGGNGREIFLLRVFNINWCHLITVAVHNMLSASSHLNLWPFPPPTVSASYKITVMLTSNRLCQLLTSRNNNHNLMLFTFLIYATDLELPYTTSYGYNSTQQWLQNLIFKNQRWHFSKVHTILTLPWLWCFILRDTKEPRVSLAAVSLSLDSILQSSYYLNGNCSKGKHDWCCQCFRFLFSAFNLGTESRQSLANGC